MGKIIKSFVFKITAITPNMSDKDIPPFSMLTNLATRTARKKIQSRLKMDRKRHDDLKGKGRKKGDVDLSRSDRF